MNQVAAAVGPNAKASIHHNVIEGAAKIGGNATLHYTAKDSNQVAAAVGPGAEAHISANRVTGR